MSRGPLCPHPLRADALGKCICRVNRVAVCEIPGRRADFTDGRPGHIRGFVELNEEDCANIYKLML